MSWLPGAILASVLVASLGYFLIGIGRGLWMIFVQGRDPVVEAQKRRQGQRTWDRDYDPGAGDLGE